MLPLVRRNWFLLLLLGVLALGMWLGPVLADPLKRFPRGVLVAAVMFITALPMSFDQLAQAVRNRSAVGLALLLSTVVAPPMAWLAGFLLRDALAVGLVVAASVPCTLASAAVWTRRGGGNDAIALVVTMVTNMGCFVVLPCSLWLLLGQSETKLDALALSLRLLLLVVLPVTLAQLLRRRTAVLEWAGRQRQQLSLAAQLGMLGMVLYGAVGAGQMLRRIDRGTIDWVDWGTLLVVVLGVHLLLFAAGWWGSRLLGHPPSIQLAVAIAGSQKTLMIGLDVALAFGGLAILPMVAYHVTQLLVDTLLVDWLRVPGASPDPD